MTIICPNCKYYGEGSRATPGSFLIEIVLWLSFLIPGLIYSLWRLTSRKTICPNCGYQFVVKEEQNKDIISPQTYKERKINIPIIWIVIFFVSLFIILGLIRSPEKNDGDSTSIGSSFQQNDTITKPVFETKTLSGKTVSELIKILGNPSSHIKSNEEMPGEIQWQKNGIRLSVIYRELNTIPQALDFQSTGIRLTFSKTDFNKALQLIGLGLTLDKFDDSSPPGFTRYSAKNVSGFKQIEAQSTRDDKTYIKSIFLIQSCKPEPICS